VVDEVSRVLPDDTWLTQMEMKSIAKGKETQREILVRGETANAGRLVQLVEESPLFAQTAPRSPTTKIQPGPGEIFDLGAQLKPLAPPAQVALLALGKPAEPAPPSAVVPSPTPAATPVASSAGKTPDAPPAAAPSSVPPVPAPDATNANSAATPPVEAAKPAAQPAAPPTTLPTATVSAPPKAAAVPPPGMPDPWISAPSTAPAPRPVRVPADLGGPSSPGLAPGKPMPGMPVAPGPAKGGNISAPPGGKP